MSTSLLRFTKIYGVGRNRTFSQSASTLGPKGKKPKKAGKGGGKSATVEPLKAETVRVMWSGSYDGGHMIGVMWSGSCDRGHVMEVIQLQVKAYLQLEEFRLKFCRESVTLRRFWLCLFPRQDSKWDPRLLVLFHMILDQPPTKLTIG